MNTMNIIDGELDRTPLKDFKTSPQNSKFFKEALNSIDLTIKTTQRSLKYKNEHIVNTVKQSPSLRTYFTSQVNHTNEEKEEFSIFKT